MWSLVNVGVQVNCPSFPISLSFWVELVGACNSIWYQSQRSRVRILAGALIKIITAHSNIPHMRPGGACTEGECWSISELPTFSYQLKLLGWTSWCMQLNSQYPLPNIFLWRFTWISICHTSWTTKASQLTWQCSTWYRRFLSSLKSCHIYGWH
jgi:hypothetical protein